MSQEPSLKDGNESYDFIRDIGSFIVNFGAVESESYLTLDLLVDNKIFYNLLINLELSKRVENIIKLVENLKIPKDLSTEFIESWQVVSTLIKTRNTIAHNSIIFIGGKSTNTPDSLAIFNHKSILNRRPNNKTKPFMNAEDLRDHLKKLNESIKKIKSIKGEISARILRPDLFH